MQFYFREFEERWNWFWRSFVIMLLNNISRFTFIAIYLNRPILLLGFFSNIWWESFFVCIMIIILWLAVRYSVKVQNWENTNSLFSNVRFSISHQIQKMGRCCVCVIFILGKKKLMFLLKNSDQKWKWKRTTRIYTHTKILNAFSPRKEALSLFKRFYFKNNGHYNFFSV